MNQLENLNMNRQVNSNEKLVTSNESLVQNIINMNSMNDYKSATLLSSLRSTFSLYQGKASTFAFGEGYNSTFRQLAEKACADISAGSGWVGTLAFLTFTLLTLNFKPVVAQQLPLYSSYVYNPMLMSPSFAGNMDARGQAARLMMAHRYQYAGFEGAPTTSLLALDAPFATQKMGLGGVLYTDVTGLIRQTGLSLNYSYKVSLGKKAIWHLGLAANAGQQALDMAAVNAVDMGENILNLESANKVYVNGTFGTHLEMGKLNFGFAAQQLTQNQMVFQNYVSNVNFAYEQPMHLLGFASYRIDIKGDTFGITPMLATRYVAGTQMQYDVILKAHVHNKVFVTAGYRGGYAASFGVGAVLNNNLTLSYTYDHMVNDAGPFTGGGNEFTLGYRFFRGKGLPSGPSINNNNKGGKNLTETEVNKIFDDRVVDMRNRMDSLNDVNKSNEKEIEELKEKIEALTSAEVKALAPTVSINNGYLPNNIEFNNGSAKIDAGSTAELDKIAAYLIANPSVKVTIDGYTDNAGNADANLILSKKRAAAVQEYLTLRGVNPNQMTNNGHGSANPIADNASENGRLINRRVEIKVK
jgi:type IX secretion system PorP/SprF family membrane protein